MDISTMGLTGGVFDKEPRMKVRGEKEPIVGEQLLDVSSAQEKLLRHFAPLLGELVALGKAVGRVLAEDIYSRVDLPPFPNSSMDGFAVRTSDVVSASPATPVLLDVIEDIPAGTVPKLQVGDGKASRIMTGAPLPEGADAVVPVEDTDFNYRTPGLEAPEKVHIYRSVGVGEHVRPRGEDVHQDELVLPEGILLRPQDVGFLAMLGISSVPVRKRPRVGVFSSGDELLSVDEPLVPGKIYDSNSYTLLSLVEQAGAEPVHLGVAGDSFESVRSLLDGATEEGIDLILSSAGVSVGAFDFVRDVVEQNGTLDFWRVNMRPGKPFAFGFYRDVPFIGLPGNPVSAFVGFQVFVRLALSRLSGQQEWKPVIQTVRLQEPVSSDGRETYLRGIVTSGEHGLVARLTGHQGSGNLRSLVQANALLVLPPGVREKSAGEEIRAWILQ